MTSDVTTVALVVRDKVSTTPAAIEAVLDTVDTRHRIVATLCCVPEVERAEWADRYGDRVEFDFVDRPLLPSEARNRVLKDVATDTVVFVDTDVYVRPGWLEALLTCRRETGAHMVCPLILERPTQIHCAGSDLYFDEVDGRMRSFKVLRYYRFPYHDGSNLVRTSTVYGELHCQLVDTAMARDFGVFDDRCAGLEEVDAGLTLHGAGAMQVFEPASVVLFDRYVESTVLDVEIHLHKWDPHHILQSERNFLDKWGFDITDGSHFHDVIADSHARLGRLASRWPNRATVRVSIWLRKLASLAILGPGRARMAVHKRRVAGAAWARFESELATDPPRPIHPTAVAMMRREPVTAAPAAGAADDTGRVEGGR